jgi:hypothetical protein
VSDAAITSGAQSPPVQVAPRQSWPQAPQCCAEVEGSMQSVPQRAEGAAQPLLELDDDELEDELDDELEDDELEVEPPLPEDEEELVVAPPVPA